MSFSLAFKVGADVTDAIKNIGALQAKTNESVGQIAGSFKLLQNVAVGALGVFGASKIVGALSTAVDEAAKFQEAINQLRIALDATGQGSDRAVQGFVDYAAQLQATTKFSDDAVLSTATLIQGLGQLGGDELKTATKAALDLSQALGIDASSAATLLGKAASGNTIGLSKLGLEIRKGKTDAETFANALSVVQQRFGGASEKSVTTYAGAVAQLKNNFDDSIKTFGTAIITNQAVIGAVNALSAGFVRLTGFISENSGVVSALATGAVKVLDFGMRALVPTLVGAGVAFVAYNGIVALSTAASVGFTFAIQYATVSMTAMTAATLKSTVALLANPIVAGAVAIGALAAFATRVFVIRDQFVSLGDAVQAAGLEVAKFFTFGKLSEEFGQKLDALKQKKIQIDAKDAFQTFDDLNAAAKSFRQNSEQIVAARVAAEAKARTQLETDNTASLEKIRGELKNAGKTQFEIVSQNFKDQNVAIKQGLALGTISQDEASSLRLASQAKFNAEVQKIDKDIDDFHKQNAEKRVEAEKKNAEEIQKQREKISGFVTGFLGDLKQGSAGTANAIANLGGLVTEKLLPGFGGLASALIGFLAQGPEAVKAQIQGFVDNIPTVIQAMVEAAPVVMETLAERAPDLIQRLVELAPELAIRVGLSLGAQMPYVSTVLAIGLIAKAPDIAVGFVSALVNESGRFITSLADGIKEALGKITGGLAGGGGGGILGAVTNPVGAVSKKFKFAGGGEIPPGFPNDSFPAFLSSGENVLTERTSRSLEAALSSGAGLGGGEVLSELRRLNSLLERGQNITVNWTADGMIEKLIFNANLRGVRLA